MIVSLAGQLMEARSRPLAIGIGRRTFQLDPGQYELVSDQTMDAGLFFSSWGLDDYFHTARVPVEEDRWMEILEEPRDALVPTKRIGYTQ